MANKDIRIYVFGVHDPALLDKPHMWTTLKDCEVDNTEQLEAALKLHLSYLPQQHALEVLEGDSDWIPVTPSWRPGPQPVIYTRMVPLQQSGNGGPSAMMVAANLALLQQLHTQLHQQMNSSDPPAAPNSSANPQPNTPRIGTANGPWVKPPSLNGTLVNGDNRRSITGGPSGNGGKDPQFTHQVWQGVVSLTGKYLDDGSQPEYELFEGVVEAQAPAAVAWPRRLLIGKLTSAVPMLMKLFENLSGRVGPLVQPFHMRITKRMPVLNGLLQSMRERNTVGIIQLEQHLMLLFAKGPDSFSVLLMPRSFSLASNPLASNSLPQMLQGPAGNGPQMPPSSGPQLPPLANLMTHLGMPPIPNSALGSLGLQAQVNQAGPLQQQVNQAMSSLLPSSMAMSISIQQHQQQQQQQQQQAAQQQQQQQQQQLPSSMGGHSATHTPQQMPTAMTQ